MKHLIISLAMFVLIVVSGCNKRTPVTALPPPQPPPAVDPSPTPLPTIPPPPPLPVPATESPAYSLLDDADFAFYAGNYSQAMRGYESYLRKQPFGEKRDQALFRLAMTYALSANGTPEWPKITSLLKDLVDHHPNSPLRAPASVILSLQSESSQLTADAQKKDVRIKQLTNELDKLKQIDAARRKRP